MFKETDKITQFGPPVLVIKCEDCKRHGEMKIHTAVRRYGSDITVAEWKKKVAEDGGCKRVAEGYCRAFVFQESVTWWASLSDAQHNGWRPILRCLRRHYALKRVNACPPIELDLRSLVATHGSECRLSKLERWARCPQCGSSGATIQWALTDEEVPDMADGLSQLVRGAPTNWTAHSGSTHTAGQRSLRDGLRMKANLAKFANALAEEAGFQWHVTPNMEAPGGRIIVAYGNYAIMEGLQKDILTAAITAGNQPIDLLHCVPPSTIHHQNGRQYSDLSRAFASNGRDCWDAVDETARRSFPRSVMALRVVQYESCRGLEGWTTVLDGLDEFWEMKRKQALADLENQTTNRVADPTLHAKAVAWRWCMIPLTRPIDTLVITIRDRESALARVLERVALGFPDAVEQT